MPIVGVLALLLACALGPATAYLAGWLFWAGLSIGALPLLMGCELIGGGAELQPALRVLVRGIPFAAALLVPVLVRLHGTFIWTGSVRPEAAFGRDWLQPGFFIGRSIVYLAIWSVLALAFSGERSGPGRRRLAGLGLGVHGLVGTLAAIDWVMSVDPTWHSGVFGLLVVAGQLAGAAAAAVLIAGRVRGAGLLLVLTGGAWLYLQFIQYLVAWSGNLPAEAGWYAVRDAGLGRAAEWFGLLAGFVLPASLVASGWGLRIACLLVLLAHAVETIWLVSPGGFGASLLVMVALGTVSIALLPLLGGLEARAGRHRERTA